MLFYKPAQQHQLHLREAQFRITNERKTETFLGASKSDHIDIGKELKNITNLRNREDVITRADSFN